jgi:hypothetical protein
MRLLTTAINGTLNATDTLPSVKNNTRLIKVNNDDDNKNNIEDRLERPPLYDTPRNQTATQLNQDYKDIDNENDLAETQLYVWIDSLKTLDSTKKIEIDIYAYGSSGLVMWSHKTKGKHFHYGTYGPIQGHMELQKNT